VQGSPDIGVPMVLIQNLQAFQSDTIIKFHQEDTRPATHIHESCLPADHNLGIIRLGQNSALQSMPQLSLLSVLNLHVSRSHEYEVFEYCSGIEENGQQFLRMDFFKWPVIDLFRL